MRVQSLLYIASLLTVCMLCGCGDEPETSQPNRSDENSQKQKVNSKTDKSGSSEEKRVRNSPSLVADEANTVAPAEQTAIKNFTYGTGLEFNHAGHVVLIKVYKSNFDSILENWQAFPLLRTLDLSDFDDLNEEFLSKLVVCNTVKALIIGDEYSESTSVSDSALKQIAKMVNLEVLDLSSQRAISDIGVGHLSSLTNLEELNLNGTPVTDAGIESLANLTNLNCLHIEDTKVTPEVFKCLQSMVTLERIDVSYGLEIPLDQLARLKTLKRIHSGPVDFHFYVGDDGLAFLGQLRLLESINISLVPGTTSSGLEQLNQLRSLKKLLLHGEDTIFSDSSLEFSNFEKLQELNVISESFGKKLKGISGLPELRKLWIGSKTFGDDLEFLGKFKSLTLLHFYSLSRISDVELQKLARCVDLTHLDLSESIVTDRGIEFLASMQGLQELKLRGTQVTGISLSKLFAFPYLKELDLSKCQVNDNDFSSIERLPPLKTIRLRGTSVTDACFEHLAKIPTLTFIDVKETSVTQKAATDHYKATGCYVAYSR